MASQSQVATTRTELKGGGWVELKTRLTLRDTEAAEMAQMARGGTSALLTTIDMLPRIIVAWSFDEPITEETVRDLLALDDLTEITEAFVKATGPNASPASSDGTRRSRKTDTSIAVRGNG